MTLDWDTCDRCIWNRESTPRSLKILRWRTVLRLWNNHRHLQRLYQNPSRGDGAGSPSYLQCETCFSLVAHCTSCKIFASVQTFHRTRTQTCISIASSNVESGGGIYKLRTKILKSVAARNEDKHQGLWGHEGAFGLKDHGPLLKTLLDKMKAG
uniref:Uncharacterized protein n=1 Tax=Cannabis sativa TaxID=3483 RepID=A0A803Q833_CANSA